MCFGRPKTPTLPEPEPTDSAIEPTATKVVMGDKSTTPSKKKTAISTQVTRKRFGTKSLQIPLLTNSIASGNLNYS